MVERGSQLGAVGFGATDRVGEDARAAGPFQRVALEREILVECSSYRQSVLNRYSEGASHHEHEYDQAEPEFAALLKQAAAAGQPLRVEIDDQPYDLRIAPAADERQTDIWANYDPARLRAVLRHNAELPERADPEEVERLIADIRTQRGQDSQGRPAST